MTILLGVALALLGYLAWRWFDQAVGLLVFLLPAFLIRTSIAGIPTNALELSIALVLIVGILQRRRRDTWRRQLTAAPRPLLVLVGLFIAAALLSTYISAEPRVSLGILKGWIIFPLMLGWLVYATQIANSKSPIARALIASGVVTALLSLTQFRWGEPLAGIYDVPNSLALWLAPIIALAVASAMSKFSETSKSSTEAVLKLLAAVFMFVVLLLTQSVGGVLAVVLALLLGAYLWSARPLLAGGLFVLVIIAGIGFVQSSAATQATLAVRQQLWSVAAELIAERPLLGVGLGQFEPHYQRVLHQRFWEHERRGASSGADYELRVTSYTPEAAPPLREFVFRDPHNWILAFWLNLGLAGLVAFIGLNVFAIRYSRVAMRKSSSSKLQIAHSESQAMALALLALLLFGLVDTIYWKNDLAALQWLLLGALLQGDKIRAE